jgi:hypothetical protein
MSGPPLRWPLVPLLVVLATTALSLTATAESGGGKTTLRPYEAPLLGADGELPPLPPEYLSEEVTGIRFAYHPSARDRTRALIEMAVGVRSELVTQLGSAVLESMDVRVAVGSADFSRIVPARSPQGSGVVAFTEHSLLVIGLHASGPSSSGDARLAFRRGMALLALDEVTGAQALPRWFRIGYGLHFSGEGGMARARSLWWASMQQRLVPLVDLDWHLFDRASYQSVAAAEATDFLRFLLEGDRAHSLPRLCEEVRGGHSFEQALRKAYQNDASGLEQAWREDIARHRAFLPILLGSTGLWILIALGLALRRRWRRHTGKPIEVAEAAPSRRSKPLALRLDRPKRERADRFPASEAPAPEVPKVSHNGRWHTLH